MGAGSEVRSANAAAVSASGMEGSFVVMLKPTKMLEQVETPRHSGREYFPYPLEAFVTRQR
jgi:hypothetical protein